MDNNFGNLYYDYIGATGTHSISDYIDLSSNNNYSYTSNSSNILSNNIINVDYKYNKLIKEETEGILKHTYITNSNLGGEIRFYNKKPSELNRPDYSVRINSAGYLEIYYNYNALINAIEPDGYKNIVNEIVSSKANINLQGGFIGTLQLETAGIIGYLIKNRPQNEVGELLEAGAFDTTSTYSVITSSLNAIGTRLQNFLFNNRYTLFLGTPVAAVIYSFAQYGASVDASHIIAGAILNQYDSNTTITTEEKSNLLNYGCNLYISNINNSLQNLSNVHTELGFTNSNIITTQYIKSLNTHDISLSNLNISNIFVSSNVLSNINLNQGFLNSNTTNQQFIPNLKTSLLNLNGGNITNINNISALGKIKENNNFLESTYATLDYVNSNLYNNSYSQERLYPPKTFNSYSLAITSTDILGRNCFKETINLTTDNITYGSGEYIVYSSSSYGNSDFNRRNLFNYTINSAAFFGSGNYNYETGYFNRTDMFLKNGYFGDWVVIKLLSKLILKKIILYYTNIYSAPSLWRFYGSDDGLIFTEIIEASNYQDALITDSYSGGFYEKIFNNTKEYLYFGIVINKIIGGNISASYLNFGQFKLYGINTTIYNNIYTTSNAVKNIVEFQMPLVSKHYAFYISITTPIIINTKTYYKYDVDLRQYTKLGYIDIGSQSGDSYRIFKLRACYGSMYFSTLVNGVPNVLYSDIFMSMKANSTGGLGVAGLNICSVGNINNPKLDTIPPNNLFFMRNGANSIDYITIVSTSPADVRCFIEDMIS